MTGDRAIPGHFATTDAVSLTQAHTPAQPEESPAQPEESPVKSPQKKSVSDLVFDGLFENDWKTTEKILKDYLPAVLNEIWGIWQTSAPDLAAYTPVLFLDQSNQIGEEHADHIYAALDDLKDRPGDILLILGSKGGRIEPAYLISKNCKAASKAKFVTVVPRRAKSAATLIALGADEIHMGRMSELGPIDPQLGAFPALSLSNALRTMAKLVTEYPSSADMFAKYLQSQLNLGILGYFERINESATQYAFRLLRGKTFGRRHTAETLADYLVNHYKDHSFVIDKDEALELFGSDILKVGTAEYSVANIIDQRLRLISRIAKVIHKKVITYVGGFDSCIRSRDVIDDEE